MPKHLFHLWDKPPTLIKETTIGYTACGRKVERAEMTRFPDDCTCKACLARALPKESAPAADQGAVPKPHNSQPRDQKQGAGDDDH